jgi:hypothetical protein
MVVGAGLLNIRFGVVTFSSSAARVLMLTGAVLIAGTIAALASRRVRRVEVELPDVAAPEITQTM